MKHTVSVSTRVVLLLVSLSVLHGTGFSTNKGQTMKKTEITKEAFGTAGGAEVFLFTLANDRGMTATITNYGGIVTSLRVPDKAGASANVVLGFDKVDGYTKAAYKQGCPYFGALIGRYGNRIANGEFSLDGKKFTLAKNNGKNHLHGGNVGFDKVVWTPAVITTKDGAALQLTYVSADGEEGYPGTLHATVVYSLTAQNELKITYAATTDIKTVVNLTHHSYFNLAGEGTGDVLGHTLTIKAEKYTPVTDDLIPTGELKDVAGTAFDFRTPRTIGERIGDVKGGYDHNFVLAVKKNTMTKVASVEEPTSGRVMEVFTTEPGLQFYSGNFLDGTLQGLSGKPYRQHDGFCLETQHFPDSPNQPAFPSTVLLPHQKYATTTIYKFSVLK
jgi:aldose 1-epimerase